MREKEGQMRPDHHLHANFVFKDVITETALLPSPSPSLSLAAVVVALAVVVVSLRMIPC